MAKPIAPTPILKGDDAKRFVEAALNPQKAPKEKMNDKKLDALLRELENKAAK